MPFYKQYKLLIPTESFVGRYLEYMSRQETAYAYDFWTALWCVSAACGRSVYIDRPRAPVYMNMYTVLIGESGAPRKSTAVRTAQQMVQHLINEDPTLIMLDAKTTTESLDERLKQLSQEFGKAQIAITVSELAVFLGTEHYIATMPTLLTDLYDCPSLRYGGGTIARGDCLQNNVWVSLLTASTPVWLLKTVNPNVIEGGFTSRCYFIVANSPKKRIAWPDAVPQSQQDEEVERLIKHLRFIKDDIANHPYISLLPEAKELFTEWYDNRERSHDTFKQSYEAREDSHVLRIAGLLAINDSTWHIDRQHVDIAIELIEAVKEDGSNIFEGTEVRTKFAIAIDGIRALLITAGMEPVPRAKLFRKVYRQINHDEFISLLDIMHEMGCVQRFMFRSGDRGRPTDYFRGTDLLVSKGMGEQVLDRIA